MNVKIRGGRSEQIWRVGKSSLPSFSAVDEVDGVMSVYSCCHCFYIASASTTFVLLVAFSCPRRRISRRSQAAWREVGATNRVISLFCSIAL